MIFTISGFFGFNFNAHFSKIFVILHSKSTSTLAKVIKEQFRKQWAPSQQRERNTIDAYVRLGWRLFHILLGIWELKFVYFENSWIIILFN